MQPAVELEFRLELQCKSSTQLARVVIGEFYAWFTQCNSSCVQVGQVAYDSFRQKLCSVNQAYRSMKIRLHQYICRFYLLAKTTTYNENNLHNFLTLMPASWLPSVAWWCSVNEWNCILPNAHPWHFPLHNVTNNK